MSNMKKQYNIAPFQCEIIDILQNRSNLFFVLEGARGSSKTSIANKAYSIWSIVGEQQIKFIVILSNTQEQARQCLTNIKALMLTEPLRSDMGPFEIPEGEWRANAIDIPKYGARIVAASIDQPIRGLTHGNIRPQVVICDDLENVNSVRFSEMRNKLYNTFTSDILPVGDIDTRFIIIGTRLHEGSLIMRLKASIESSAREGIFRSYPIMDDQGNILWKSKYPNIEAVERERRKLDNEVAWQREYLLRIIPDVTQVIHSSWIHYYDKIPEADQKQMNTIFIGVDLAISMNESRDETTLVSAAMIKNNETLRIYILPFPIAKQMTFPDTVQQIESLNIELRKQWSVKIHTLVEQVQYQEALVQQLQANGKISVEGVRIVTDKRSRLVSCANFIQQGIVLFPRHGAEKLIEQIIGFGIEKHDDLMDAFTLIVRKIIESPSQQTSGFYEMVKNQLETVSEKGGVKSMSDWVALAKRQGG